jgi:N-acetylneuraminic acid mutarotase
MLVFGANLAYTPRSNSWRTIHASLPQGIVAWTGREAIGWGGGCCGDALANGAAYTPAKDSVRRLPRSPLAPSQKPLGAWDGRELLIFVSGYDTEGKLQPMLLARGAAYNPSTNTWRRIAALPTAGARFSGTAAWAGRELLVAGAGTRSRSAFAYTPATNHWRRLASLPSPRAGASAFWSGRRLLLWGGAPNGLSYDPSTNRWSLLARPALRAAESTSAVWTGRSLIAFGGVVGSTAATNNQQVWLRGTAAFTPAAP